MKRLQLAKMFQILQQWNVTRTQLLPKCGRFWQSSLSMCTRMKNEDIMRTQEGEFLIREAKPSDKDEILAIEPNVHEGLDYLPACYDDYLTDVNRHLYVAVKDNRIISVAQCQVVDNNTTAALATGRTIAEYRKKGIGTGLCGSILERVCKVVPTLKRSTGVYQLPMWNDYLLGTGPYHKQISRRKADGFEVTPNDKPRLLERLNEINVVDAQKPVRIPGREIWENLKPDEARARCFPDKQMLISSETYQPLKETFQQIKDTKARNVFMTFDDLEHNEASGISFRNGLPVPFGFLYKIDIFSNEDMIFNHFVTQVLDSLKHQDPIHNHLNIMLAVFFPFSADKKSFLELCRKELELVPSKNAKVSCDVSVLEYGFGVDPGEMLRGPGHTK